MIKGKQQINVVVIWDCPCGWTNQTETQGWESGFAFCPGCKATHEIEVIEPKPMPYVGSHSNGT